MSQEQNVELVRRIYDDGWSRGDFSVGTDLMTPDSVTPMTRLVLVNSLYLKVPWWEAFPDAAQAPFHTPTKEVSTPSVSSTLSATYPQGDNYRAVTIPYAGRELAMMVVLPDEGAFEAVGDDLGSIAIAGVSSAS